MAYDFELWRKRHVERSDLTTELVHLTRSKGDDQVALDSLFEILESGKLIGSTTFSGFIVGDTPAVCFQDAPLSAVGQNCWFEQTFREENTWAKKRYDPTGVMFSKTYVFEKGGRPVVYDRTSEAKTYLPKDQWWRIVNFDLSDGENIRDWSHEREWRIPQALNFKTSDVILLFSNNACVQEFIDKCDDAGKPFYRDARGITTMESVIG